MTTSQIIEITSAASKQLEKVLQIPGMNGIELKVNDVIKGIDVVSDIVGIVDELLERSLDVTIYTSREVVVGESAEEYLEIGARVTDAMTEIIKRLTVQPRYIISKGGMTSSNVTTNGLGMVRSLVPGQILPGVLGKIRLLLLMNYHLKENIPHPVLRRTIHLS